MRSYLARYALAAVIGVSLISPSRAQSLVWDRVSTLPWVQYDFGNLMWTFSDVDGDQVKDVLVGAVGYVGVLSGATGATIFELRGVPGLLPIGTVGDTTGDGMVDFIVLHPTQGSTSPVISVVSGATGAIVDTRSWSSTLAVGLGDTNGDGLGDFAVAGAGWNGWVDVYHGPGFNYAYTVGAQWAYSTFGYSIASCGDVNGDGSPDFIVGAPGKVAQFQLPEVVPGFAHVFSGANGATLHNWTGPFVPSHFGEAVMSPGDINGDGIPDIVVAAPGAAALYVFSGATGVQIASFTDPQGYIGWFGSRLVALGDVDGDGIGDYAARGSPQIDVFSGATTARILHFSNLPTSPWTYNIAATFGALSDFNGDDVPEILIGSSPIVANQSGHIQCFSLLPSGITMNGAACPQSTALFPRIGASGVPHANSTLPVTLSRVPVGMGAGLIVGLSNTTFGSIPLPWQVNPLLAPGCFLFTSIDWFLPTVTTSASPGIGSAIMPLAIPPGTTGLTFYAQWGIENPPGSPTVGSVTRSLEVTIQ
jgi:FG-GAP-like repeat/FG-GAP repeat